MQSAALTLNEIVEAVVKEHTGKIGALLPVLHGIQQRMGFVPEESIPMIARLMGLSRAEVHGVIHFYHDFRSQPGGTHTVQVCRAEACQAMGSHELEQHVKKRLGIDYGETTSDGRFSLEPVYCLGNCACTPSIRINDDIHARVSADRFDALLQSLQEQQ